MVNDVLTATRDGFQSCRGSDADCGRTVVMLTTDDRIDRRILDQARSLVGLGWQVTVIASPQNKHDGILDEASYPDISIIRMDLQRDCRLHAGLRHNQQSLEYGMWRRLCPQHNHLCYYASLSRSAIIVAHDLVTLPAAILVANEQGSYVIYDAHELYADQPNIVPRRARLYRRLEDTLIRRADVVMTVNRSVARLMALRYNISIPRVILNLPRRHSDLPTRAGPNPFRDRFGIDDGMSILLYQGNLAPGRNLENLVLGLSKTRNRKVCLVLMGYDCGLRDELMRLSHTIGLLDKRIFFHVPVKQRDLLTYTAAADAGVIPYTADDLNTFLVTPNKLYEYIVAGLPILANDLPELVRFVGLEQFGLLRPLESADQIGAAIDDMFECDLAIFRTSLEASQAEFEWSAQDEALKGIYDEMLQRKPISVTVPLKFGGLHRLTNCIRNGLLRALRMHR